MTEGVGQDGDGLPRVGKIRIAELFTSLSMGWQDFGRAPLYGFVFSALYVVAGLALVLLGAGTFGWTLTVSLGFPLVAPFAAVGLYEVSRRLEAQEPLDWGVVLSVLAMKGRRQIPVMGAFLAVCFVLWVVLAQLLFAVLMGASTASVTADDFLMPLGLIMMTVGIGVGGLFAFFLFSVTVVSLPLLLERNIGYAEAMRLSLAVVHANPVVMAIWAAIIAGLLFLGMLPAFLGLFIVLPVLGHATWHLYRRALYQPI